MTPYHADPWLTVWQGDCREVMAQMEPGSVHCVVTSPPYWGLRDYGVDGALGLEPTPEEYVANMVAVFREVRRVLRKDGTCWVNLGDCYNSSPSNQLAERDWGDGVQRAHYETGRRKRDISGLKPKDLVGIPWRVAFALQADGWYLRSDIIWSKPNPMPESVTDRPTKAHEYVFLLSKSARYYYDADAVREAHNENTMRTTGAAIERGSGRQVVQMAEKPERGDGDGKPLFAERWLNPAGRNLRSVWSIATQPYPGAHFATFPEALVEPCVKAGTSERGVCPECGAPWRRMVETTRRYIVSEGGSHADGTYRVRYSDDPHDVDFRDRGGDAFAMNKTRWHNSTETTGWRSACSHRFHGSVTGHEYDEAAAPIPATVLDPFAGSGTTGRVAQRLGRRAVLIDLNGEYLVQAMARNADIPLGLEAM